MLIRISAMLPQPARALRGSLCQGGERLVIQKEKLTGKLPEPGASLEQRLDGDRTLTVRVQ